MIDWPSSIPAHADTCHITMRQGTDTFDCRAIFSQKGVVFAELRLTHKTHSMGDRAAFVEALAGLEQGGRLKVFRDHQIVEAVIL